jgi:hypothetical protein
MSVSANPPQARSYGLRSRFVRSLGSLSADAGRRPATDSRAIMSSGASRSRTSSQRWSSRRWCAQRSSWARTCLEWTTTELRWYMRRLTAPRPPRPTLADEPRLSCSHEARMTGIRVCRARGHVVDLAPGAGQTVSAFRSRPTNLLGGRRRNTYGAPSKLSCPCSVIQWLPFRRKHVLAHRTQLLAASRLARTSFILRNRRRELSSGAMNPCRR